ncbi:MAG: hypothetical protein ACYTX0_54320, partial [Nostoc sp.]
DTVSLKEKHSIKYENLFIERIYSDGNMKINLLKSSPFILSINRHAKQENSEINIQIQWDEIQFYLGKADYASINRILKENFQEKILYKIPQIQSSEQQQQQLSSSNPIPQEKSSKNDN